MKLKDKQEDLPGYKDGFMTGLKKGHKKGLDDAYYIISTMLEENGVTLKESEFKAQIQVMIDSGEYVPDAFQFHS